MTHATPSMFDLNDLIGVGDIANMYDVSSAAICNWRRTYTDFPDPVHRVSSGQLYSRIEIQRWRSTRWPS